MKFLLCGAFGLFLVVCVMACDEKLETPTGPTGPLGPIDPTATFTRVQNEIFTPSCAAIGCHDTLGHQEGLVLERGRAYANIVGVTSSQMRSLRLVAPNDPTNSYLYRKMTGSGISGDRMPQGGPFLTDTQIALVRDWIRRGAPND